MNTGPLRGSGAKDAQTGARAAGSKVDGRTEGEDGADTDHFQTGHMEGERCWGLRREHTRPRGGMRDDAQRLPPRGSLLRCSSCKGVSDRLCWVAAGGDAGVEADATQWQRRAILAGIEAPCRFEGGNMVNYVQWGSDIAHIWKGLAAIGKQPGDGSTGSGRFGTG